MNDFQDQAKNWLRNVVKQNPDKIKAGVEKAGDLIDKQTGGKYADKVDSVQEKVGSYVDSHADPAEPAGGPGTTSTEQSSEDTTTDAPTAGADEATAEPADSGPDQSAGPGTAAPEPESSVDEAAPEPTGSVDEAGAGAEETVDEAAPDAVDGTVVGGEAPDVAGNPSSSAGSGIEGADTGSTATGTSDGGLPGPR
ncbi:Rv0909 family putative TA system antitoxin [Kribbella ginsengisoli]|uniref:Antitoxin protein of toxin-antitoxin system n=1 Tax=Kribbella ginsengisoli TaxID=363865 RepID=A0ABP6W405_9ACTN